jgi:hypothetical protein
MDTPKPRFSEVCQMHHLDYQAMQNLAKRAGVTKNVIDAMAVSVAVRRVEALAVLAALSDHTGQKYSLETVRVAILPTFKDFHKGKSTIVMLYHRRSLRGQSIGIALCKLIGSLLASLDAFFFFSQSALFLFFYVSIFVYDVIYVGMVVYMQRRAGVKATHESIEAA